jgi:MYXO-CTERM domain-containing protein
MEKMIAFASVVTASLLLSVDCQAGVVLIDFDNLPGGGTIPSGTNMGEQYASLGVHFSAWEDGAPAIADAAEIFAALFPNPPANEGNAWFNLDAEDAFGNRADIMRVEFDAPVNDVSWYTDSEGGPPAPGIRFEAYDADGFLIETVFVGDTGFPMFQFTQFTMDGISRIDMLQPADGWGWSIDNLSFTPVPAPGALALLGLAGLASSRRRRD